MLCAVTGTVPGSRGHSSAGRALVLHTRGQGFDSPWLHCEKQQIRCRNGDLRTGVPVLCVRGPVPIRRRCAQPTPLARAGSPGGALAPPHRRAGRAPLRLPASCCTQPQDGPERREVAGPPLRDAQELSGPTSACTGRPVRCPTRCRRSTHQEARPAAVTRWARLPRTDHPLRRRRHGTDVRRSAISGAVSCSAPRWGFGTDTRNEWPPSPQKADPGVTNGYCRARTAVTNEYFQGLVQCRHKGGQDKDVIGRKGVTSPFEPDG